MLLEASNGTVREKCGGSSNAFDLNKEKFCKFGYEKPTVVCVSKYNNIAYV